MSFCHLHVHTMFSILDSCTSYKDYIQLAKKYGQDAIAFTEHGNIYNWISKYKCCKENGIKYIHGCEIYLTKSLKEKERDNFHTILLAKNEEGLKEINTLISISSKSDHFYYKPRISFDEFLNISDNVIKISACLKSPLNCVEEENIYFDKLVRKYDFLEVQPHKNSDEQKEYNKKIIWLSEKYNKPIVATSDVHSANKYKAECRKILIKAKKIHFKGEDNSVEDKFDLTFKSEEEMRKEFEEQGVLNYKEIDEAIENSYKISKMCDEFTLDISFKYPKISDDDENYLKQMINEKYKEKVQRGYIKGGKEYIDAIHEEFRVFKKLNMITFMLSMARIINWCKDNGIPIGPSRGSVAGSMIAYLCNITEVDPIRWKTIFSRFANENRLEIGD